ncbi:hypothetical protein GCM10009706_21460 [Curtobacterium citreum]|nr:hypothetical protein GCM10009706_21460 [Curtobacterium citreum]
MIDVIAATISVTVVCPADVVNATFVISGTSVPTSGTETTVAEPNRTGTPALLHNPPRARTAAQRPGSGSGSMPATGCCDLLPEDVEEHVRTMGA